MNEFAKGPATIHPMSDEHAIAVEGAEGDAWAVREVVIGAGRKIICKVMLSTADDAHYPKIANLREQDATAELLIAAINSATTLANAGYDALAAIRLLPTMLRQENE